MENGAQRILAERNRQIHAEGYDAERDVAHTKRQLLAAAACYLFCGRFTEDTIEEMWRRGIQSWPWDRGTFKPSLDPIRNLEKAGALIAAEIDRLMAAKEESK